MLGNIKAGLETLRNVSSNGELGVALSWFAVLPLCQDTTSYVQQLDNIILDEQDIGSWVFGVHIEGRNRHADPAQARILRRDGTDLWNVACALERDPTQTPLDAARLTASTLIVRAALPNTTISWSWPTPLGQTFHVRAIKQEKSAIDD